MKDILHHKFPKHESFLQISIRLLIKILSKHFSNSVTRTHIRYNYIRIYFDFINQQLSQAHYSMKVDASNTLTPVKSVEIKGVV